MKYYNNIECKIISKISEYESVIEIYTASDSYYDEFGEYGEPIYQKLIVDNKYISDNKITSSSIAKEKELMLKEITQVNNKKIKEANIEIEMELKKLQDQIKTVKDNLNDFDGLVDFYKFVNNEYKYFFSKDGINGHKIVSKEDMLEYKDGRDTKLKAVGFKYIQILDKESQRYKGKHRIAMEVYHYSDGSGGANYIEGFETIDEAIIAYTNYLNSDIIINRYDLSTCDKYKITNEKVTIFKDEAIRKDRENNKKEILRLGEQIERIKNRM